jgi:FAD/FMN-containing dehydrogenase
MGDPTDPPAEFIATCRNVVGAAHVLTAAEDKLRFESDFWGQYRGAALAVLRPGNTAEVAQLMVLAARHGVPVVPQAGNTGLVNGGIPDGSGREAVLSLERLNRLRAIDAAGDYLVAEAGCVLDRLQPRAAEVGRFFPLAMGSGGTCQIGGNLSTNGGGINVLRYGMAQSNSEPICSDCAKVRAGPPGSSAVSSAAT